jgi:hypothetical protein
MCWRRPVPAGRSCRRYRYRDREARIHVGASLAKLDIRGSSNQWHACCAGSGGARCDDKLDKLTAAQRRLSFSAQYPILRGRQLYGST